MSWEHFQGLSPEGSWDRQESSPFVTPSGKSSGKQMDGGEPRPSLPADAVTLVAHRDIERYREI